MTVFFGNRILYFILFLFFTSIASASEDFGLDIINNATKNGKFDEDSKNKYFIYINENRVINLCDRNDWAIRDTLFIGCKNPITLNEYAENVLGGDNVFVTIERFDYNKENDYLILYLKVKN